MTNDDPFSSFYGKRFSVSGKDFDDGNGHDTDNENDNKQEEEQELEHSKEDEDEELAKTNSLPVSVFPRGWQINGDTFVAIQEGCYCVTASVVN
jgi:hypothetical protein